MKTRLLLLLTLLSATNISAKEEVVHKKSVLTSLEETRAELEALDLNNAEELTKISCELIKMLEIVKTITIRTTQKTVARINKTIDFSLWGQLVDENNKQQHDPDDYEEEDSEGEQE